MKSGNILTLAHVGLNVATGFPAPAIRSAFAQNLRQLKESKSFEKLDAYKSREGQQMDELQVYRDILSWKTIGFMDSTKTSLPLSLLQAASPCKLLEIK